MKFGAILILLSLSVPLSVAALDVPKLTGYVNDYGRMISSDQRVKLEETLRDFERSDSTQVAVLTIPSLEGESLEEYSMRVVQEWKLGQAHRDNGVLLLVSRDDRRMRIEVGRGLEGRLTDLMAGRIVDLVIRPSFKRGDYDGGFIAGISTIIDATRGEFKAEERPMTRPRTSGRWLVLYIFFFVVMMIVMAGSRRSSRVRGSGRRGVFPMIFWPGGGGGWSSHGNRGGFFGGSGGFGGGGGGGFGGGGASGSW